MTIMVVFLGATMFYPVQMSLAKDVKIGVIDVQKIVNESKAAKEAKAELLKDMEIKRSLLIKEQNELKELQEAFNKDKDGMSDSERKEKQEEINQGIKELRRLKADLEEELKKKDRELAQELLQEIKDVAKKFLGQERYTVIVERRFVVVMDDAVDVTAKIIKMYDARNK
jgi:outer membrane protein